MMTKYISIRLEDGKHYLKEPQINTFQDRREELFGYTHVMVTENGQFLPDNVYVDHNVGKFKIFWITDNWLGYISNGYRRIDQGYPVYVFHKGKRDEYYLVKEYQDIATIERYFEILDHYQNFKSEEYVELMLGLANTCAKFREVCGTNKYLSERYGRFTNGLNPYKGMTEINGADEAALSIVKEKIG